MDIIIEEPTEQMIAVREDYAATEYERNYAIIKEQRRLTYIEKSDPVFFQYQRGEKTEQDWIDAIAAVDASLPYPEQPE